MSLVEAPQSMPTAPVNAGLEITTSRQMLAWLAEPIRLPVTAFY